MNHSKSAVRVHAPRPHKSELPFGLAQALVRAAEEKAEAALAKAERDREEKLSAAWLEGFRHGRSELEEAAEELREAKVRAFEEMRPQFLELVFSLTKEVLGESLKLQPETLLTRLDSHLSALRSDPSVKLHFHPEDLPLMVALLGENRENSGIETRSDEKLPRGAARIEAKAGTWEINPFEHLERLERHIHTHRLIEELLSKPIRSEENGKLSES